MLCFSSFSWSSYCIFLTVLKKLNMNSFLQDLGLTLWLQDTPEINLSDCKIPLRLIRAFLFALNNLRSCSSCAPAPSISYCLPAVQPSRSEQTLSGPCFAEKLQWLPLAFRGKVCILAGSQCPPLFNPWVWSSPMPCSQPQEATSLPLQGLLRPHLLCPVLSLLSCCALIGTPPDFSLHLQESPPVSLYEARSLQVPPWQPLLPSLKLLLYLWYLILFLLEDKRMRTEAFGNLMRSVPVSLFFPVVAQASNLAPETWKCNWSLLIRE